MSLKIACTQCHKNFKVADNLAGKKVNCPSCKTVVPVPAGAQDELTLQPAGAAPVEDDLKLYVPGEEPGAKTEVQACPACGHDVPIDGVLCVHCGYNLKTKQSVRGHEIKTPGRGKIYLGTMISGLFFFLLVCAGGYAIYYAFFKADITKRFREMNNPEASKEKEEPSTSPISSNAPPAVPTQSLLVVANGRFPRLTIFKDGGRIGQADLGKTEKIPLPPGDPKTPVKISFEVRVEDLPRGTQLNGSVRDALSKGLNFDGTTSDGVKLVFAGPPADLVPKGNEVLQGVPTIIGEFDKATGTGKFKAITYKGNTLKTADDKNPLRLGWKPVGGNKVELTWLEQDCIVEKDGKVLYQPPAAPFKPELVKLSQKDGKVDVAP